MKLAPHYRIVGVHEDSPLGNFICGGNSAADSDCRDARGLCQVIEFLHGMSDFAAYRTNGDFRELISWEGNYDSASDTFLEAAGGPDKLSLITENEYNAIYLNDGYVSDIEAPGLSGFKVFTLSLDFDAFIEEYGANHQDEDEFPGVLWDIAAETEMFRPGTPGFDELLTITWDYMRNSGSTAQLIKDSYLPKG